MRNNHETPPRCGVFQALGSFCPLECDSLLPEGWGRQQPGQSLEPALRLPITGSQAEPWEVEMALPPSCFSHQHSQAPGQALATSTSRNNILATDSRPGLQHCQSHCSLPPFPKCAPAAAALGQCGRPACPSCQHSCPQAHSHRAQGSRAAFLPTLGHPYFFREAM